MNDALKAAKLRAGMRKREERQRAREAFACEHLVTSGRPRRARVVLGKGTLYYKPDVPNPADPKMGTWVALLADDLSVPHAGQTLGLGTVAMRVCPWCGKVLPLWPLGEPPTACDMEGNPMHDGNYVCTDCGKTLKVTVEDGRVWVEGRNAANASACPKCESGSLRWVTLGSWRNRYAPSR